MYENLIKKYLISNNHRSTVSLHPSNTLAQEIENREVEKLKNIKNSMSHEQLVDIRLKTKELIELQSTPDSDEAIATLPLLERSDLDRKIKILNSFHNKNNEIEITEHPLFTNGVLYIDSALIFNF